MKNSIIHNKRIIAALVYFGIYLAAFELLEMFETPVHYIHTVIDDYIPFCEYFIIFYVSWFIYLVVTILYYALARSKKADYINMLLSIMIGMTGFIIVSLLYPNGHNLRPEVEGDGLFSYAVRLLYSIDTPTNVLPSMHVYCAVACMIAWWKDDVLSNSRKWVRPATGFITVMIVLSTVFLKQHTVIDVVLALLLNIIVYQAVYKLIPYNYSRFSNIINFKDIKGLPNILSIFRIILAVVFLGIHARYTGTYKTPILLAVLAVSGITDYLDGRIARRYNMVTEIGKILDPFADKITQAALLIYLTSLRREALFLLIIFVAREIAVSVIGGRIVLITGKNDGAMWFGKLNTFLFYFIMLAFILFPDMPYGIADTLMILCTFFMVGALCMYIRMYRIVVKNYGKAGV